MQQHTAGGCNTLQGSALCHRLAKDAQFAKDAASLTTNSVKLVVGRTRLDNVAKVDQKDQGYKDGIFQVETCRIREVYKTKPMANLTCFNVSSRTACGTLKIHMLPSTASINMSNLLLPTYLQTGSCHHLWREKFILDDKWRGEASPVQGDECHSYAAASVSGMHVLSYVTAIFPIC